MIKYNKRKSTFMLYLGILCSISLIGTMTGCERQPKNVMNNNSIHTSYLQVVLYQLLVC